MVLVRLGRALQHLCVPLHQRQRCGQPQALHEWNASASAIRIGSSQSLSDAARPLDTKTAQRKFEDLTVDQC